MGYVMMARKKYKVYYPYLYAPEHNEHKKEFDCVQRSHQNYLEVFPWVMTSMLVCGLQYPLLSSSLGLAWIVGRVIYFIGYTSRLGPNGRLTGALLAHCGDWPLLGLVFVTSWNFIHAQ